MDDRRRLALILYDLSKILPKAERQQFAEFLFGQPGTEAPRRKVHSWKKRRGGRSVIVKRPPISKPQRKRQLELDLE